MTHLIHSASKALRGWRSNYSRLRLVNRWVVPEGLDGKDLTTYRPIEMFGHTGIDLRDDEQLERLERWSTEYRDVYAGLRDDAQINVRAPGRGYVLNDFYPTPDAEVYASMILDRRPSRIVEVGSGFSTRVAHHVIKKAGLDTTVTAIDPEPRADIRSIADVMSTPVENITPEAFPAGENAIVFIDSSHITRARGDVPYLFLRVLPALPSGTLVHVHDVFIPYDYPYVYQHRLYTEQYILQALLCHSDRYHVVFATHYMSRTYPEQMGAAFGAIVRQNPDHSGASFWFQIA